MVASAFDTGRVWGLAGGVAEIAIGERVEIGDDVDCLCDWHGMFILCLEIVLVILSFSFKVEVGFTRAQTQWIWFCKEAAVFRSESSIKFPLDSSFFLYR